VNAEMRAHSGKPGEARTMRLRCVPTRGILASLNRLRYPV
jgi:hypothetical protein